MFQDGKTLIKLKEAGNKEKVRMKLFSLYGGER